MNPNISDRRHVVLPLTDPDGESSVPFSPLLVKPNQIINPHIIKSSRPLWSPVLLLADGIQPDFRLILSVSSHLKPVDRKHTTLSDRWEKLSGTIGHRIGTGLGLKVRVSDLMFWIKVPPQICHFDFCVYL